MFLLQKGGTGLCYMYTRFTGVLVALFVDADKGRALSVIVCVSDCTGLLCVCIYLSEIHVEPHFWTNLQTGAAAVAPIGLGQRDFLGLVVHLTRLQ